MKSIEEVALILERSLPPRRTEVLPRAATSGRVLARRIQAATDVPGVDVSAMDGYACRGALPLATPIEVVGTIAAGDLPGFELAPGRAARIMTGAPVPADADRVVPIELTNAGETTVELARDLEPGAHIRRRAEIIAAGEVLLETGTVLRPSTLAWLASHGIGEVEVVAAPRVAFATTGDEVVAPEVAPQPGQLRDSHSDFLAASLKTLGIVPESLGILPDRREALDQAIAAGLRNEVLILCGGVSAGAFDFVEPALRDQSCRILIDAVAIQPGKPLVVAMGPSGQLIFGLPGNPASVFVTYTVFVRPTLERLLGLPCRFPIPVRLGRDTPSAARERDRYVPVELDASGCAVPVDARGSHDLSAFAVASGLVRIPQGCRLESGTVVPMLAW